MEVHHAQATPTSGQQSQHTFPFIGDFLPRVVLATSDYGSDCSIPAVDIHTNSDFSSDESSMFIPNGLKLEVDDSQQFNQFSSEEDFSKPPIEAAQSCANCDLPIHEKLIVNLDGRYWHENCLFCDSCDTLLHNNPTCYSKDHKYFCKTCYTNNYREFARTKCSSCDRVIQATDWVRRAKSFVYHLACFACDQCKRQLSTGEEYSLQDDKLLCKQHFVELVEGESGIAHQKAKTKRVRTTFAEEQLNVLQTHFQIDSNPDGADLERIATMTGLSKRVTQVWFQNSRARQKKYQGNRKDDDGSQRSSVGPMSPGQKSENSNDMIYPTSVTTSAEDAIPDSSILLGAMQFE